MAERQWSHDELKGILELGPIADLEKLIANPGRKYREQYAHTYAIDALRNIAESDVLPEDIRVLVQRVLELHEKASNPFLGMDLSDQKQRQPDKPRVDIEAEDAEAQAHQDWSNDE
ncbi:MAG TPA: hypothetical protein VN954_07755 [Ktedonobacteraceae bacterium]|nr:hypothetical protein [Ktedonobacteraceae bacterium]